MDNESAKEIKRFLKLRNKAQESNNLKEESECCNVLGIEYLKIGDFENALSMHKSEYHICQSLGDNTAIAVSCRNIGDVYVAMHKFSEAIDYHKKHLGLSVGNDVELQRANTSLGRTYLEFGQTLSECSEAKEAFIKSAELLKESLRIVTRLKEDEKVPQKETNAMKIRSLINLGLCFHHISNVTKSKEKHMANVKSKEFFQKALYLAKKLNFKEDLYLANFILVTVNTDQQQYSCALRNVEEAITLAKAVKKSDLLYQALELCAQVHLYMDNIEAAKLVFKKLYKRNVKSRDEIEPRLMTVIKMSKIHSQMKSSKSSPEKLCQLHEAMADLYCNLACYNPAVKHYKIQAELLDQLPSSTSQQKRSVYFSIASTLADAGDYKEAIRYYDMELQCTNDQSEHCKTFTHIADCMEKMEAPYHEIVEVYEKALTCSVDAQDHLLTLRTLASLDELQMNFKDQNNSAKTRCAIAELEMKLGVCVDELLNEDKEESFQNISLLEDSEELLEAELQCSDDDDSDEDEPVRRRRKTNFNKTNEKGESQLHRACIEGQLKSVEVLIKQGHPVNPRDFCGWIPLHEACNHGHEDIATFLLKHGANINDTGGQYCDNITPINDAAINGHFEVVEILLDSGANPNITSVQGKSTLDSLIYYYHQHKEDLDPASKHLYKALYKRLKELSHVPADFPLTSSSHNTSALISLPDDDDESESPSKVEDVIDDDLPLLHRERGRNHRTLSGHNPTRSGSDSINKATKDRFQTQSSTRRTQSGMEVEAKRASNSQFVSAFNEDVPTRQHKNSRFKTSPVALTADHVDDDDWLIPDDVDTYSQPTKKHKRGSAQLKRIDPSLSANWNDCDVFPDTSFPAPVTSTSGTDGSRMRTAAFRIRMKINEQAFLFAVPDSAKTIAWLTDKAAVRFKEVTNLKPVLRLTTSDGCLLSPDDAVYDVLNNNDSILGQVVTWKLQPFSQQYVETCMKDRRHVLPRIKRACEACQTNKTFQLSNLGYSFDSHLKPVIMCLGQQELRSIQLPGNRMGAAGLSCLCTSLNAPSPNPQTPLVDLNLTCCELQDDDLASLTSCNALKMLKRLSLSFNPLCDGINLIKFLSSIKNLEKLDLKSCWLRESFFKEIDLLKESFQHLSHLCLSKNNIEANHLQKLFRSLNRFRLKRLELSNVSSGREPNNSLSALLTDFIATTTDEVELIDISENQLSKEHVAQLRRIENFVEKIYI